MDIVVLAVGERQKQLSTMDWLCFLTYIIGTVSSRFKDEAGGRVSLRNRREQGLQDRYARSSPMCIFAP
jgi:hypothetical protein